MYPKLHHRILHSDFLSLPWGIWGPDPGIRVDSGTLTDSYDETLKQDNKYAPGLLGGSVPGKVQAVG